MHNDVSCYATLSLRLFSVVALSLFVLYISWNIHRDSFSKLFSASIQKSKFLAVIFTLLTIWEKLFVTWVARTTVIPGCVFHGYHPTDVIVFTYVDTLSYIRWTLVFFVITWTKTRDHDLGPNKICWQYIPSRDLSSSNCFTYLIICPLSVNKVHI